MCSEPFVENGFKRLDKWFVFQLFDDFGNEGLDQKTTRFIFRNAAGTQVEQMIAIDLCNRCAMAAGHIIRKNLQLRLGIEFAII